MSHHHHASGHDVELGHTLPLPLYYKVFGALIFLTIITVAASYIPVSSTWHMVIAMFIASIKAGLVAAYFMHLKYEDPITWAYAAFPVILLALLLLGLFTDSPFRVEAKPVTPTQVTATP